MPRVVALAALVLFGCTACDQASAPPSRPTPSASPSPAVDLRTTAATAYAAALSARTQGMEDVEAACAAATTTAALQDCWTRRERVQKAFGQAFDAITFPTADASEVAALGTVDRRLDAAMAGLASAADPRADRADDGIVASESAYLLAGTIALRNELGIPVTPTP